MLLKANSALRCFYLTIWRLIWIGKPLENMMMDYSVNKDIFLYIPNIFSYSYFSYTRLGNVQTQREWITLQRFQLSPRNIFFLKIGDGYAIAATFKLHTNSTYSILIFFFFTFRIHLKNNAWSLENIHLNRAHYYW